LRTPVPRVELRNPVRLDEYVVGDKIELSLRGYIDLVLANNTDIQVERLTIEQPRNAILRSYGIFDPLLFTSFQATRTQSPASDVLAGAQIQSTLAQPFLIRAEQMLPTGTRYFVQGGVNKFSTNSQFATFNPSINSNLNLRFEQPLLRNRGMYLTKLPITVARSRVRQSEYSIQDRILRLVTTAENAYWDVIFARENLTVQEQNLALNEEFLKRARRELELGAISQLDIYQPEAQYKNAELSVTQARFRLQATEDALRRQIAIDLDPKLRDLPLVLTEDIAPPVQTALDRETFVQRALQQRPDLLSARQQLDVDDLSIQSTTNFLKPDLRLTGTYASAGLGGVFRPRSGTVLPGEANPILPGTVIPGGLGDSLSQLFGFGYPTYAFGLTLSLPLRDRRAAADYADAVVNKRLDMLRLRTQEQGVRLEVVNAITEVERSRASVELAKVALDLAQKRLEAERKKFDLGTTTLFFVLDAQTEANQAQSNLVNQTVQFRRNLTNLSRSTADLLSERGIAIQ
jgi:outer membrane protein TolC